MDLSKAFHTLYHNLWLTKLNEYGFSISVIKFLYIYFSEQLKRLNINNNFSEWCKYSWENHRVISRSLFIQHIPWWHFLFYTRSLYKAIQSHTMSIIKTVDQKLNDRIRVALFMAHLNKKVTYSTFFSKWSLITVLYSGNLALQL